MKQYVISLQHIFFSIIRLHPKPSCPLYVYVYVCTSVCVCVHWRPEYDLDCCSSEATYFETVSLLGITE